jgi:hypothetical protein
MREVECYYLLLLVCCTVLVVVWDRVFTRSLIGDDLMDLRLCSLVWAHTRTAE